MRVSNRQKRTRGWGRRLRELDVWAAEHTRRDVRMPEPWDYLSAELWYSRWPQPFPMAIRRRMVQHLVGVHDAWLAKLSATGEPGYLGIWLFEPGMRESQVVAASGERAGEYRERHHPSHRSAPPARYQGCPYDLSRFEWTRHVTVERALLSEYAEEERPWMLGLAKRVERAGGEVHVTLEWEEWRAMLPAGRG